MGKVNKINVQGAEIAVISHDKEDYISLTDMVKKQEGDYLIKNWLRNKNTIEFLGIWESLNNRGNFNLVEFDQIRKEAGVNKFLMSGKQWINRTNAIGIVAKTGRYGGTYAQKDIAYHFAMWLSPEFQLLIIKEFDRLKAEEARIKEVGWNVQRYLAKVNYHIQTDSIKKNLIPISTLPEDMQGMVYA